MRIDPMRRLLLAFGWLLAMPCLAGQETPYVPARDDIVLQTVASISDPRVRAFGDVARRAESGSAGRDAGRETLRGLPGLWP